ncbi:MAG: ribonuclease D [Acidiferrobacterales bacterium]
MFDAFIQDQSALRRLSSRLRDESWIAIDTEFVRERTYYAQLCLIQIATPMEVICIDPLAVDDLDPLLDAIYTPQILKVFHSARQDLEVFHDLRATPPAPVFDTQIAAALTGYEDQIGYAALVESLLDVRLAKLHTRADWSARSLSQEQLRYAEDDVRYLPDLYAHLNEKLVQLGRSDWLAEECERLTQADLYRNDPEQAYVRIKRGRTLSPPNQNVLRVLAAWRERTAQRHNRPRNWILRDAVLVELARDPPKSRKQLEEVEGLSKGTAKKWSPVILEMIRDALGAPAVALWLQPQRLNREQSALRRHMVKLVETRGRELGITPALLATRKDIKALVLGETNGVLLTGWRRRVVGEKLLAMLKDASS